MAERFDVDVEMSGHADIYVACSTWYYYSQTLVWFIQSVLRLCVS